MPLIPQFATLIKTLMGKKVNVSHRFCQPFRSRFMPVAGGLMAACVCVLGCDRSAPPLLNEPSIEQPAELGESNVAQAVFQDLTAQVGLEHVYHNGEEADELAILETIGGGVAVIDFDRDGYEDLFFPGGGDLSNKTVSGLAGTLWKNQRGTKLLNVSHASGTDLVAGYTHGSSAGDLDGDGFADLLVTGYSGLQLFLNQGDGTFIEAAQDCGLNDTLWSTSSALGDFNSDGLLDIYITHYVDWSWDKHPPCQSLGVPDVCPPGNFIGLGDIIYFNDGNGSFTPAASEIGLDPAGKGLGVMVVDINQDNQVDIYVANDTTNNFLYDNQGDTFQEIGLQSGSAVDNAGTPQGSMGLCTLDFDDDLRPDILVCNYESQAFALYKNDGGASFRYATSTSGLMALGTTYVAFGSTSGDFDLDGDEDIAIANGHVMRNLQGEKTTEQHPLYLTNLGHERFERQVFPDSTYFGKKWRGRGVAAFDWDRDGDLDLAFSNVDQPSALLENATTTSGKWWIIELVGTQSNRDAVGARIVFQSDKRKYLRNVIGGGSYLSQNPYYIHFALPENEQLLQAEIFWPSGATQVVTELKPNHRLRVVETP